jgi:hypothetical protein
MFEGAHGGPQLLLLLLVVVGAGVTLCARMGVANATMAARFNFMVRSFPRILIRVLRCYLDDRRCVALCSASSLISAFDLLADVYCTSFEGATAALK